MQNTSISPFSTIRTVSVFVLEDLRHSSVIPKEPALPILVEDDDEAPICVGGSEWEEMRRKQWESSRPHRSNGERRNFNYDVPDVPDVCEVPDVCNVSVAVSTVFPSCLLLLFLASCRTPSLLPHSHFILNSLSLPSHSHSCRHRS